MCMAIHDYYKSIEQIAAGLAHEVKNPLSLVRANIDLLELSDSETMHKKNYRIMRRELERINDLLLDFIHLTRPSADSFEKVRVAPIVMDLIDVTKTTYTKEIDFVLNFQLSETELAVMGDKEKIRRVFLNIIKNAVEAIDSNGRIKICISQENSFVKIVFEDNGKGFSKDDLERVCMPFYTTKEGGSGLGIYICKTIIEEHNGSFEIKAEANKGCTVTVMLPTFTPQLNKA